MSGLLDVINKGMVILNWMSKAGEVYQAGQDVYDTYNDPDKSTWEKTKDIAFDTVFISAQVTEAACYAKGASNNAKFNSTCTAGAASVVRQINREGLNSNTFNKIAYRGGDCFTSAQNLGRKDVCDNRVIQWTVTGINGAGLVFEAAQCQPIKRLGKTVLEKLWKATHRGIDGNAQPAHNPQGQVADEEPLLGLDPDTDSPLIGHLRYEDPKKIGDNDVLDPDIDDRPLEETKNWLLQTKDELLELPNCTLIPVIHFDDPTFQIYKCAITQKPIRHIVIPKDLPPDDDVVFFEKAAVIEWLQKFPNKKPPSWPASLSIPKSINDFVIDRSSQFVVDRRLEQISKETIVVIEEKLKLT